MSSADQMIPTYNAVRARFTALPPGAVADPDTAGIEVVTKEEGGVIHFTAAPNYTIPEGSEHHECGHALHYMLRYRRSDIDWMKRYWDFRGFEPVAGTWQQAQADAYTHGNPWPYLPGESLAEAFRIAYMGFGSEKTLDYGKTINPAATLDFFKSLNDEVMPVAEYGIWTPSPNYNVRGAAVSAIVAHWTTSPLASTLATFQSPYSGVSAHFVVARDGRVYQMVETSKRAWHDSAPGWNDKAIGIEFEHYDTDGNQAGIQQDWPDAQLIGGRDLYLYLTGKYGALPVVGHGSTYATFTTECPGDLPIGDITGEDMFTEEDRQRQIRIETKLNAFTDNLPKVWLRRLFYGFDPFTRTRPANPTTTPPPADLL